MVQTPSDNSQHEGKVQTPSDTSQHERKVQTPSDITQHAGIVQTRSDITQHEVIDNVQHEGIVQTPSETLQHEVIVQTPSETAQHEQVVQTPSETPQHEGIVQTPSDTAQHEGIDTAKHEEIVLTPSDPAQHEVIDLTSIDSPELDQNHSSQILAPYPGVKITNTIKNNGLKKLLQMGVTGAGKSSLCNVLAGFKPDAHLFPISSSAESCTQRTKFAVVNFNGDETYPVSLIDTTGFDDPQQNKDAAIIAELVGKLKNDCDHVNLFLIVVNGTESRLNGSETAMLEILERMFGKDFWKCVIIAFTRIPMGAEAVKLRFRTNGGVLDKDRAENYLKALKEVFPTAEGVQYLYLDSWYNKADDIENTAFKTAIASLLKSLNSSLGISTDYVRQVETDNDLLKRSYEEQQEKREKLEKELKEACEGKREEVQNRKDQVEAYKQLLSKKDTVTQEETEQLKMSIEKFEECAKVNLKEIAALKDAHEAKGYPSDQIIAPNCWSLFAGVGEFFSKVGGGFADAERILATGVVEGKVK